MLGQNVTATMSIEPGGINSTIPIYAAAKMGIPLIDADGMGRAFPEIPMVSFALDGVSASPMVCVDEKGNQALLQTIDNAWVEKLSRAIAVQMRLAAMIGVYGMNGKTLKKSAIRGTMSLCIEIGKAVFKAKANNENALDAILKLTNGSKLFKQSEPPLCPG